MISTQAKTLLAAGATVGIAKYMGKDWKTALTYGAVIMAAYLVVTMLPDDIV